MYNLIFSVDIFELEIDRCYFSLISVENFSVENRLTKKINKCAALKFCRKILVRNQKGQSMTSSHKCRFQIDLKRLKFIEQSVILTVPPLLGKVVPHNTERCQHSLFYRSRLDCRNLTSEFFHSFLSEFQSVECHGF